MRGVLGLAVDSKSPTFEVLGFTPTLGQSAVATVIMLGVAMVKMNIDSEPRNTMLFSKGKKDLIT
jgi:hypothetical protein